MSSSILERFLELARSGPDRVCLYVQDGLAAGSRPRFTPVTRLQLVRRVATVARALGERGVQRGDSVLLSLANGLPWIVLDLACQAIGAITVVVHPSTDRSTLAQVASSTSPRIAVVDAPSFDLPSGCQCLTSEAIDSLFAAVPSAPPRGAAVDWVDAEPAASPTGTATIMYTSGSTGQPKGAILTHEGLIANAVATAEALALHEGDALPALLSFSHSAGRTALLHTALVAGASVALLEPIDVECDAEAVAATAATVLVVVPRVLERLLDGWQPMSGRNGKDPLTKVRAVLVGGASLAPSLAERLQARRIPVFEAYGATEATCTITMNRPAAVRTGTVGRALPGIECRVAEDGEILCRGPSVMRGFHGDPTATMEFLDDDGWLHTGDLGHLDTDGFLHLVGRKKDVFLAADGSHFAPARIEAMLESLPSVQEAVVCGDGRPFVAAFVLPRFDRLSDPSRDPHASCPRMPICTRQADDLAACPRVRQHLRDDIDSGVNVALPTVQAVKALRVLSEPLPLATRALTATAKVKVDRRSFCESHAAQIQALYEGASDLDVARTAFRMPIAGLMTAVSRFHERWYRHDNRSSAGLQAQDEGRCAEPPPTSTFPEQPADIGSILERFNGVVASSSVRFNDSTYAAHMVSALPAIGIAAAALMAILNQNQVSADASPATTAIEHETVRWLAQLVGYDAATAGGLGAAGGSIANITALLAARNQALPRSSSSGVATEDGGTIVVSNRMHYSFRRAAELLGLGAERGLVRIPVDATNRMSLDALLRTLDDLDRHGRKVVALAAIAGTSETGNIDPIEKLADIAEERKIWLHVDAAMGACALASPRHRKRFAGIERADSITLDPHKWFYVPYHCAYVLFRDKAAMRHLELTSPHFVVLRTDEPDLGKWSIEGSRAANALKFWMVAQAIGRRGYAAIAEHQIELVTELASLIDRHEDLERLSVPELNILCFRFVPSGCRWALGSLEPGSEEARQINQGLDDVNVRIHTRLMRTRHCLLSRTTLESTAHRIPVVALRAVFFHPELERNDVEHLMETVAKTGREVIGSIGDVLLMSPNRDPETGFAYE